MNWKDLVDALDQQVPNGSITTSAQISRWAYGIPNWDRAVRSMLNCARNNGFQKLANRVVGFSGKLADMTDGSDQRQQLLNEGIPFADDGRVDLTKVIPVVFHERIVS